MLPHVRVLYVLAIALLLAGAPVKQCFGQKEYPIGRTPSDAFIKGVKDVLDSGFTPKDTLNIFNSYATIDSSDVGTTILVDFTPFKNVRKVWTVVVKSKAMVDFPFMYQGVVRNKPVNPFVGVEEWDFDNTADAQACIKMMTTPGSFNGSNFNLHRPPREFVQKGNIIYYFYTFPPDFYPYLSKVRDIMTKYMGDNVEVIK